MSSAYECAHRYHQPSRDHGQPAQTPRGAHSAHTLVLGRLGRWRGRSWCCPSWWCCPEAPELFQGRTQSFSKRIHNFTRHAAEGNRPISVEVLQEPADRAPRVAQRTERWVRRHIAGFQGQFASTIATLLRGGLQRRRGWRGLHCREVTPLCSLYRISGQSWASTHQHSNPKPLHPMYSAPVVAS